MVFPRKPFRFLAGWLVGKGYFCGSTGGVWLGFALLRSGPGEKAVTLTVIQNTRDRLLSHLPFYSPSGLCMLCRFHLFTWNPVGRW